VPEVPNPNGCYERENVNATLAKILTWTFLCKVTEQIRSGIGMPITLFRLPCLRNTHPVRNLLFIPPKNRSDVDVELLVRNRGEWLQKKFSPEIRFRELPFSQSA